VQTAQHSSDLSDDERVYYDAEDEQPMVNFTTQPKGGKTPPKKDVKQTPPAATSAGAYPEAPKICLSKFWGRKCSRGNNCEFHGPDSDKLEREAHTKYIKILDIHERCPSDSDVKLVNRKMLDRSKTTGSEWLRKSKLKFLVNLR
jgi:hypothetical protein